MYMAEVNVHVHVNVLTWHNSSPLKVQDHQNISETDHRSVVHHILQQDTA